MFKTAVITELTTYTFFPNALLPLACPADELIAEDGLPPFAIAIAIA
jgi:hypothetical protein